MKPQQRKAQESSPAACQRLCEGTGCVGRGVLLSLHIVFVHFQEYFSFAPEQYLLGKNAQHKSYFLE